MKYIFVLLALFFLGCGKNSNKRNETGMEKSIDVQQPNSSQSSLGQDVLKCLEKNADFINFKPLSLTEFSEKIGEASLICKASLKDIKQYAEKIIDKHGDL